MDTLQCGIVLAKLEQFDWEVEQRLKLGGRYNFLMDELGIPRVQQRSDRTSVFAQYTVFVDDRDAVQTKFKEEGIPTAVHYPVPLNEQPAYQKNCACENRTPVAAQWSRKVMSLPMHPYLDFEVLEHVVRVLCPKNADFS